MVRPHLLNILNRLRATTFGIFLLLGIFIFPFVLIVLLIFLIGFVEYQVDRIYSFYKEHALQDDLSILPFTPARSLKLAVSEDTFKPGSVYLLCSQTHQSYILVKTTLYYRELDIRRLQDQSGAFLFPSQQRQEQWYWWKGPKFTSVDTDYLDSLLSRPLDKEQELKLNELFAVISPEEVLFNIDEAIFGFSTLSNGNAVSNFFQTCHSP